MTESFQFTVEERHPALAGHFPGRPVVPGVIVLDHVLTNVTRNGNRQVAALQRVKFVAVLLPRETAHVSLDAREGRVRFAVEVVRQGTRVTLATGSLMLRPATAVDSLAHAT